MKKRITSNGLTVNAISGTHCVFLGFDMPKSSTKNLLGFAIQREDISEQETIWLRSIKTFKSVRALAGQEDANSLTAPFQSFQWADYTVKPGHDYKYRVFPMTGKPEKLIQGPATTVPISAENPEDSKHGVYFNRGAIASQAYAKRFGLVDPFAPGQEAALEWLSRDILHGILDFIARAKGSDFALRVAIYETQFSPILDALAAAKNRGVDVHVVYGANAGAEGTQKNIDAIAAAGLDEVSTQRTNAKIPHNKFVVLLKKGKPVAVWTGSMNWTSSAVYGQLNTGHAITDTTIAKRYLDFWTELSNDPAANELRPWVDANSAIQVVTNLGAVTEVFSPHSGKSAYQFYLDVTAQAKQALFMTFPFGMSKEFREAYDKADETLRYALLDKYVNGGNKASQKVAIDDTERIRGLPNVGMALGAGIKVKSIDGWMREANPLGVHVHWVHSKFMLVDPLGSSPTVITGSANWSLPSTNANDENMLVIKGDTRVAHIYFTEFMRLFAHHRFRESVARHLAQTGSTENWQPQYLKETAAEWVTPNFTPGTEYDLRRKYFAA